MKKMKLVFSVMAALFGLVYAIRFLIAGQVIPALVFVIIFWTGASLTMDALGLKFKTPERNYYDHD